MPVIFPKLPTRVVRLLRWHLAPGSNNRQHSAAEEQPLRDELLNVSQLEHHAKALAAMHSIAARKSPDRLIQRLRKNEQVLLGTYDLLAAAVVKKYQITPAAEWMLDNFFVIEEQIRTARRYLPRSYSEGLPQLAGGTADGLPRAYGIAMELIAHSDGSVDATNLNAFISGYQSVVPLTLGELWAIPTVLRLALIENLRRMAVRLASALSDRDAATEWAGRMSKVVEQSPSDLIMVLADLARADPPLTSAFVAELTRHLHGQSPHFAFAQSWLEHRLAERGSNIQQLVQLESQKQAADQVSIGNSITSLRVLSSADWRDFVETQSIVEQTLRRDPAGVYAGMGPGTRDAYRHAVEEIAKYGRLTEPEVAEQAILLARVPTAGPRAKRLEHVGFHLVDEGRATLERMARTRAPLRPRAEQLLRRFPLFFFLSFVALFTASIAAALIGSVALDAVPRWMLALIAAPVLMCVTHLAIGIVNWLVTIFVRPRPLPRMDFRQGIPEEHRTMVVIPTILSSERGTQELLERIELHYVANRDPHIHFALLTDPKDAAQESMPQDRALLDQVVEGIESLNQKYQNDRPAIFFLFHRPRRWHEPDRIWMALERKRGKLKEFTGFLRGGEKNAFSVVQGELSILPKVRYVITLDTDTQLPRDAAQALVGAMAHPLNRPIVDPQTQRVCEGYGILQPRVAISLPSASRSWFARLFSGESGLDPYTRTVSDVYQDLFAEGSFIGKGIYDVDAFNHTCTQFPDNTVLSHDLIEGACARSALLSDVELYEDHPSRFFADASRRHRWIRGDWQIARWLLPRVPGCDGTSRRNPVSSLSRWKILDNLRRSLVSPSMIVLLLFGWLLPWSALASVATFLILSVVAAPQVLSAIAEIARKPSDLQWHTHLLAFRPEIIRRAGQVLYAFAFLPYEAWISIDAVVRTLLRVMWTRRRLLEWTTSSDAELHTRADFPGFYLTMRVVMVGTLAALGAVVLVRPENFSVSAPLLGLWLTSPAIAWWLSRPILVAKPQLTDQQDAFLRTLARKTWRYFEDFVTQEDNWLPPDNFQEQPASKLATRTSPTNIGMALLSNLAAADFGYCSSAQFLVRTQNTLATLGRLERYQGHFYNWYDTRSLNPLWPLYVSTVDSGNLAMHLLVLRQGLLEQIDAKVVPRQAFAGLRDTARVLADSIRKVLLSPKTQHDTAGLENTLRTIDTLESELGGSCDTLIASAKLLERATELAGRIASFDWMDDETRWWAQALLRSATDHREALAHIAPWTSLFPPPETMLTNGPNGRGARSAASHEIFARLERLPTLREVSRLGLTELPLIDEMLAALTEANPAAEPSSELATDRSGLINLRTAIADASERATACISEYCAAADLCLGLSDMDFTFLFDESRDLFSIGYNVSDNRLDTGYYDLLASEARAASYFAIAQGQLGQEHWFALRRMLTLSTDVPALLSWNGSMFEYLMPLLVMPSYENTLLGRTYTAIVQRQIDYGRQRGIPWGISESAYNTLDVHLNYQYRGFGVPGLGLKRGLVDDSVVAPYATVLALMVAPEAACRNLERLTADGRQGAYGFYEAVDYTPARVPRGASGVMIRSFFAHHEGMSLLSLDALLQDRPMQRRFLSDPALKANELLLQERIPRTTAPVFPHAVEASSSNAATAGPDEPTRVIVDPNSPVPEVQLLSNGKYHVMVNAAGGGYSRWRDLAVTRWHDDPTLDGSGTLCYLRDVDSGKFWSCGHQPTLKIANAYEAIFTQAKAEIRRRDEQIDSHLEISVSPEDDIELRRITLTNRSDRPRRIELTTYAEVVLAPLSQDLSHPAFSNLFVQTEIDASHQGVVCTRRPRSPDERPPWMIHLMTVQGETVGEITFETDRMKFIGRGRTLAAPAAMDRGARLTGSYGAVLDPIVSIRRTVLLSPGGTARIDLVFGVAETREAAIGLSEKYHDQRLGDRVFELAWTHSQVELRHINATESDAQTYARLAGAVIYAAPAHRAASSVLLKNRRPQSGLWGHGISGDLPIVLVRIRDIERLDLIRQVFQAHTYWRMKGLHVDVVIWNEDDSVYRQELHETIMGLIAASPEANFVDRPGGVYLRRGEQIPEDDRGLLLSAARAMLVDDGGTLREQVERRVPAIAPIPAMKPLLQRPRSLKSAEYPTQDLMFFNGYGGFSRDGREYVTILQPEQNTPAPWVNVIANSQFGTVVTESGGAYTWAENSHEFRLTPWNNDPIGSASGEAIYLRDEESGRVWSPTPQPARGTNAYVVRHGFGYTCFEYEEDGLFSELTVYVAKDDPLKFARLKITNRSGRPRRLSATGYWELVLGELRCKTRMHLTTEIDPITSAIFARNAYSNEFGGRVAFVTTSEINHTVTGDRMEFLGRNGSLSNPAALRRVRLSGHVGAGFDSCAAIQVPIQIEEGHEKIIVFTLGSAKSEDEAREIIQKSRGVANANRMLDEIKNYWDHNLGTVRIETPEPSLDFLVNGWLPYQTLACRMWARTGFYQSGGAFGFRDQLQDVMALVYSEPALVRDHLLRAAARQFREGDVQHWWHAHSGRGSRTRCSDDFLWLPHAACRYVTATGDASVWEERVPFLEGRAVRVEEEAYYDLPQVCDDVDTLYGHCVRAINNGLKTGVHGLPLMGSSDWNDGMNLVGAQGKGESVWLAFFLYDVLTRFVEHARGRDDHAFAEKCMGNAAKLRHAIDENGWDGAWYRRAYFDDGQALGSAENTECQIDSLPQSWAVLSGAGEPAQAKIAMDSMDRRLIHRDTRLMQLFDPPFDSSRPNPGYIMGYIPGVRENGGQYTHAAIWAAMAFAEMGDCKRAWEVFSLLNPINHGSTAKEIEVYKVEPYVVAADVYGAPPHTGRGGWTWYTGSSGWMYRLITESLLGLRVEAEILRFSPCIPSAWPSFKIHYRYRQTVYHITFRNADGGKVVNAVVVDGSRQIDQAIHLKDDREDHFVDVNIE